MATRILVQCKTDEMPGSADEKIPYIANAACRKVWNRDFNNNNPGGDRLTTFGGYFNPRCILLIDSGPVDATEYTIKQLLWKGQQLLDKPGPVHPYIQNELRTQYQFNPADRPTHPTYTDEELKEVVSPEMYSKHIQAREEQIARAEVKQSSGQSPSGSAAGD